LPAGAGKAPVVIRRRRRPGPNRLISRGASWPDQGVTRPYQGKGTEDRQTPREQGPNTSRRRPPPRPPRTRSSKGSEADPVPGRGTSRAYRAGGKTVIRGPGGLPGRPRQAGRRRRTKGGTLASILPGLETKRALPSVSRIKKRTNWPAINKGPVGRDREGDRPEPHPSRTIQANEFFGRCPRGSRGRRRNLREAGREKTERYRE